MASRKLLTIGLIVAASFFIIALTLTILASGRGLYLPGKVLALVFIGLNALQVSKIVIGIKKGHFITTRQGLASLGGFALIGIFLIYNGQESGGNIVSQILFRLGIGVMIISLLFLFASLGMWANDRW